MIINGESDYLKALLEYCYTRKDEGKPSKTSDRMASEVAKIRV
jgi:hypothetical protein